MIEKRLASGQVKALIEEAQDKLKLIAKMFQNGPKRIDFVAFRLEFELGGAIWNSQILHFRSSGETYARAENPSIQHFSALFYSPLERRIGSSSGVMSQARASVERRFHPSSTFTAFGNLGLLAGYGAKPIGPGLGRDTLSSFAFSLLLNTLVMCDAYTPAGEPIPTNKRYNAEKIFSHPDVVAEEPRYGIEQEYTLLQKDVKWPIGWPKGGYPRPQNFLEPGTILLWAGADKGFGWDIVDSHYKVCLYAGINISGINGEVMPGQVKLSKTFKNILFKIFKNKFLVRWN
ncbi:hypothetical protein HYC85_017182 [Camellia sinensis]|uniref:GS catalytic domain-containing protein n=1 Tax=Camellia sinensis TaxID=4442 RepID=A0A7J7H524_CAMSI|nr:hypothetical protein HYC85_017182 [Camellia sinensis]